MKHLKKGYNLYVLIWYLAKKKITESKKSQKDLVFLNIECESDEKEIFKTRTNIMMLEVDINVKVRTFRSNNIFN